MQRQCQGTYGVFCGFVIFVGKHFGKMLLAQVGTVVHIGIFQVPLTDQFQQILLKSTLRAGQHPGERGGGGSI